MIGKRHRWQSIGVTTTRYDLAVINGSVVSEGSIANAHLGIRDGKIASILSASETAPNAERMIDARGKIVLPGAIEPHCHFWEPGEDFREGWETGTRSAAAGGMTTVIEMPLSTPPTVDEPSFELKLGIAQEKSAVDFALWGGVIPESAPELRQRIGELQRLGAVGCKVFMCWSAQKYPPIEDGLLLDAMKVIAEKGLRIGIHAENQSIIETSEARLKSSGRSDPMAFVESRPPEAELEAINRALFLGKMANVQMHIVHLSLAEGALMIRKAKLEGQSVSVETAPQYLTLTFEDVARKGPFAKCAPPLRSRENVERLWGYVLDGTIDFIGADHAPFTKEEKESPSIFWDVPNGLPGIQESFSVLLSEGVNRRGMNLGRLADLTSTNVARRFGLYPRKGTIRVGSDADLIIVDLDKEWTVRNENTFYRVKWTPYDGMKMKGKIEQTVLRGRIVFKDGEVTSEPGLGHFILPAQ